MNGSQLTPKRMTLLPGARRRGHPPKMTTVLRLWIFLLNSPTSEVRAHCFGMKSYTPSHQHSDQLTLSLDYGRINWPISQPIHLKNCFFRGSYYQLWELQIWVNDSIPGGYGGQYCYEANILLAFGCRTADWEHGHHCTNKKSFFTSMSLCSANTKSVINPCKKFNGSSPFNWFSNVHPERKNQSRLVNNNATCHRV